MSAQNSGSRAAAHNDSASSLPSAHDDADCCVAGGKRTESSDQAITKPVEVDLPRIARAVREILAAVGEDPDRDGLLDTPNRVARMYQELFRGLRADPGKHLHRVFEETYDELVLVRDISFNSMCEHHLLPFMGVAHVGYLPNGKVAGLSKLARVVEEIALRPQVQERMTHQIADLMEHELGAKGVVVVIEATHTCMTIRGVRKPGSLTVTSAVRGLFKSNPSSRSEAMALINRRA
jgi:GTP cyclohydrolase I